MVNNQKINAVIMETLKSMPYELKVNTFDANCMNCPFARYIVVTQTHYTGLRSEIDCGSNKDKAIQIGRSVGERIKRACVYGGEFHTLEEVITNTCKFWDEHLIEMEAEDAEFIQVENVEELEVCLPIVKVKNLF